MPHPWLSNAGSTNNRGEERTRSYGQDYRPTIVDRFGVWLSARQIRKWAGPLRHKSIGDFGCGYHATFVRSVLPDVQSAVLIDSAIAHELKADPRIQAIEGKLPDVLMQVPSGSLDVVLCISVLEHLWEPENAVRECFRILRPSGICLFNVPSWRGKWFLEFSAFRLGLSPADEIRDHKSYYDVKHLRPLLIRAGFHPDRIACFSHKFGLNTFAVCRK